MSNIPLSLTSYAINAVWQLPLLLAAGWCLSRWLKKAGPELQHRIWISVLVVAALAPAVPIFRSYFAQPASSANSNVPPPAMPSSLPGRGMELISPGIVLSPTAIHFISAFYVASLLLFSIRLCAQIRSTSALVARAGPAPMEPEYAAMWDKSKVRFSIRTATLLRSNDVSGPVTAGFRHPVVILPAAFFGAHSQTEFLAAVAHECAHVRRDDYRKNLFYEVIALATAFHPATWFIKSQIAQTREMVCDRMAAEQFSDRRAYGQCLLQLASKMPPAASSAAFHTIGMFDKDVLERRIMTLMTSPPRVTGIRRYLLGGTAVVLLSICAGVTGSFSQPVAAQTPKQPQSAMKQESGPNLDCTYYDKSAGFPGTCGRDQQDNAKFVCYKNQDPTISQLQIGCEWKVLRAEQAKQK
ncbi:MAG: M56 family metallopeptidase [Bryobacteraceae bacterium]|nr:M56 family metallopeptidase [Bryobacteraceae bacterium]